MVQNLMVWLLECRIVLSDRAEQLRKQLVDTEAEIARLEKAEIVYRQYQEDAEAGHPDAAAGQRGRGARGPPSPPPAPPSPTAPPARPGGVAVWGRNAPAPGRGWATWEEEPQPRRGRHQPCLLRPPAAVQRHRQPRGRFDPRP